MTFKKLQEYILDLQNISENAEGIAKDEAIRLLNTDSTTHNVKRIEIFVDRYFENRKPLS